MVLKGPPIIQNIEHLGNTILRFTFEGKTKDIDISSLDFVERYPKLKDPDYVKQAFFEEGCIKWPDNGPWLDADELEHIQSTKSKYKTASMHNKLIAALKKILGK